jgi:hypothetical protein
MVKKQQRARSFARTAPKSQEKNLIENAKALKENPFLVLPECTENQNKKYFNKLRKRLEKVHRYRDDATKLEKLANKKGLDGALAGTLLLTFSEKAPYLAFVKFSTGDVTYAKRGKADKEYLIAVQHFDDPILRLLGVKDLASKKKLYVYSWDNGFFSTGKIPNPPKEFFHFLEKKLDAPFKNETFCCNHITPDQAKNKEFLDYYYLRIYWKSAQITIAVCESCASSIKNTMFNISKYILVPKFSKDFDIEVIAQVIRYTDSPSTHETSFLREYLSGELSDLDFIRKNVKNREDTVKQSKEKVLVLDGISYGSDVHRFVEALHPKSTEKAALEFILEKVEEPVVFSNTTPNKILEKYWTQYGKEFLDTIVDNQDMVESLICLDDTPSNIIALAYDYKQRRIILSHLPSYESLPPLASFADRVARTYKTFGEKSALLEIKKCPDNPKGKSIAYAFLLVFGKGSEVKWRYSKEELEYGMFLKQYAQKLLDAKPEEYSGLLQGLLTASGLSEVVP